MLANTQAMKEHEAERNVTALETQLGESRKAHNEIMIQLQHVICQRDQYRTECDQLRVQLEHEKSMHDRTKRELDDLMHVGKQTTSRSFWIVPRHQVTVLHDSMLGGGAWGYVKEGRFRGQQVAVKCIHEAILTQHTTRRVYREICIISQLNHPNLVQFKAAVLDDQGPAMIVIELMDMTLRKAYEDNFLSPELEQSMHVFLDVATALHYLHELEEPIIHRDLSSANVLMKAMTRQRWIAKVSDFGSANWAKEASTVGEGAIVYTAPESFPPHPLHRQATRVQPITTKMDVYSFGILLCEVVLREFPDPYKLEESQEKLRTKSIQLHSLMLRCTQADPSARPSMAGVLSELDELEVN